MATLVQFIERQVGHPVFSRCYTDTGPILERDLAQRAGLGWIGKNTCLINPRRGSYVLLAEILLDIELEPDAPFETDHCGKCTRCMDACPTDCILPDRTLDAGRCISYLTIELKDGIPSELRSSVGNWVFGCDICQMVCPWNRFGDAQGDAAFCAGDDLAEPGLTDAIALTREAFSRRFKGSPVRRAKHLGYRRNALIALGNRGGPEALAPLQEAARDPEPMIREHATWAISQITTRARPDE
jgi:epoxyqueuosine reductase